MEDNPLKKSLVDDVCAVIDGHITAENISAEVQTLAQNSDDWELPYGLSWTLKFGSELVEWERQPKYFWSSTWLEGSALSLESVRRWRRAVWPLVSAAETRLRSWLKQLERPDHSGQHENTAFALNLILDFTQCTADTDWTAETAAVATKLFPATPLTDPAPDFNFLSPSLMQIHLMSRVLSSETFPSWLSTCGCTFLSSQGGVVGDPSDAQLCHLDGYNLSRAWTLSSLANKVAAWDFNGGIVSGAELQTRAKDLIDASVHNLACGKWMGDHWIGTFATLALSAYDDAAQAIALQALGPGAPAQNRAETLVALRGLVRVVDEVALPVHVGGDPWTQEQSAETMLGYLRGECEEVATELALINEERVRGADASALRVERLEHEVGDVLFDALLMARTMERDHGVSITRCLTAATEKVMRRCPFVFGDAVATTAEEARAHWARVKEEERAQHERDHPSDLPKLSV